MYSEGAHTVHHGVSTRRHLFGRFTARAAVAKQQPIRALGMNLGRGKPLILAIVPFEQIAIDFGYGPEPGQLTSARRTLQRARKYFLKIQSSQSFSERACILIAALCKWKVSEPCMLTREAPIGLAMPGQVNNRKHIADGFVPVGRALAADAKWVQPSDAGRRRRR